MIGKKEKKNDETEKYQKNDKGRMSYNSMNYGLAA